MKKSNFAKYLLYKFKSHIGIFAASIVLTLVGFVLSVTLLSVFTSSAAEYYNEAQGLYVYLPPWLDDLLMAIVVYGLLGLGISALGLFVLSAITPILSFKFYNNRAFTDMIGSLPLNYTERFFGDLLSGFAAVCLPYLISVPYVCIMSGYIGSFGLERFADLPANFSQGALELALIVVSTYTFSSLMVSLCGKISSSVFYTLAGSALIPGIIFVYVLSSLSNVLGVRADVMALGMIHWIPPVGLIPDFVYFWGEYYGSMFRGNHIIEAQTYEYVIAAILTVAYVVGAYFVGKYRKTENIGKDVVYKKVFWVFAVLLEAVAIGVVFGVSGSVNYITFIFAAILGFLCFIIIDLVHTKNAKRLFKDLFGCAAVCAVCLVFSGVAASTKGFGAEDYVPAAEDVAYIEAKGGQLYLSEINSVLVYDDTGVIEEIISEHKSLLSQKDKLETGTELEINYKLKNGMSVLRSYSAKNREYESIILNAAGKIRSLTQKGEYPFGVLSMNSSEYSDLSFTGVLDYEEQIDEEHSYRISETFMIKPEKTEEFKELLLNDLKNTAADMTMHLAPVFAYYTKDGQRKSELFYIFYEYEDVYDFIKDPENRITISDYDKDPISGGNEEVVMTYSFQINLGTSDGSNQYVKLDVSSDSDDPEVAELISLCSIDPTDCTYMIEATRTSHGSVFIKQKDEARAEELIFSLLKKSIANKE